MMQAALALPPVAPALWWGTRDQALAVAPASWCLGEGPGSLSAMWLASGWLLGVGAGRPLVASLLCLSMGAGAAC
jgi:hypothetical protein